MTFAARNSEQAPAIDAVRIPRPQGKGIDVGAYEWYTSDVGPIGGTADAGRRCTARLFR